jgi:hypothetical protein
LIKNTTCSMCERATASCSSSPSGPAREVGDAAVDDPVPAVGDPVELVAAVQARLVEMTAATPSESRPDGRAGTAGR